MPDAIGIGNSLPVPSATESDAYDVKIPFSGQLTCMPLVPFQQCNHDFAANFSLDCKRPRRHVCRHALSVSLST